MKIIKPILLTIIQLFFVLFTYAQKAEWFQRLTAYNYDVIDMTINESGSAIFLDWSKGATTNCDFYYQISKCDSLGNFGYYIPAGRVVDGSLWPFAPVKVKTDKQDNFYLSYIDGGPFGYDAIPYLRKYLPDGTLVWEVQTSSAATDIAVDDSSNVYITSDQSQFVFHCVTSDVLTPLATQKISSSGTVIWTDTINHSRNIATGNGRVFLSPTTICLSDNDSVLWTAPVGGSISTFHDKVYITQGYQNFYCYNEAGILQWNIPIIAAQHTTNSYGYSALIKPNKLIVVDSSGTVVWQHTNVRALDDVAIANNGDVCVMGSNHRCNDWLMCPIYVPYYTSTIYGGNCSDLDEVYHYAAKYSYDSLNNNFITVRFYDSNSTVSNSSVYYCAGDNLDKAYDCGGESYNTVYDHCGQFAAGNQFIQLIDDNIAFTSPDTIYNGTIPLNTPTGINYYKVVSTSPAVESNIYQLYINPNPPPVITTAGTFVCPGDTIFLTVNYPYPNCGYFGWYRNNNYYASGYNTIPVTQTGPYTVVYDPYDGDGCELKPPSAPVNIRAAYGCFTHIHHAAFFDGNRIENATPSLNLYPNPFTNKTTVFSDGNTELEIAIYSTDGRLVKTAFCNNCNSISMGEELAAGTYYLHYKTGKESGILPFIKL